MNIEPRHVSLVEDFQSRHRAGLVTLLFTDLAGSAKLKSQLGDAFAGAILDKHHSSVRQLLKTFPTAREVSTAGDSFFIVFDSPSNAVLFALRLHKRMRALSKEIGYSVRDRVGIHVGEVFYEQGEMEGRVQNFIGIHVDTCARVMSICEPERTLMTRFAYDNAQQTLAGRQEGIGRLFWLSHGLFELKGVQQPTELCEVWEKGMLRPKPLQDTEKVKKFLGKTSLPPGAAISIEEEGGWRGAVASRRKEVIGSLAAAWVAVAIVIFSPFLIQRFDAISYDFDMILKGYLKPMPTPQEAIVVQMDEESHNKIGRIRAPDNAPWDHSVHAQMVERLTHAGVAAIVFDVLFKSNQPTSAALIKACKESGHVFLPALEKKTDLGWTVDMPFPEIQSAANFGLVEEFSKTVPARRFYRWRGFVRPPLLAQAVAQSFVKDRVIDTNKVNWLNFYGPPGSIPHISYWEALSTEETPDSKFANKVVYIGAVPFLGYTGGHGSDDYVRSYDEFPTPLGKMPGVELNATACLNLIRGEALEKIRSFSELEIFLGIAAILAIGLSFMPTGWAVLTSLVVAVAFAFGSSWMVWQTHQWFSWAVVSLVEIPTILLCSIALRTDKLTREKRALEETIVAQHSEFMTKASLLQSQTSRAAAGEEKGQDSIPDHRLLAAIGKGAYGEVWLAMDLTNSFRAIKIVRSKNFQSAQPFEREFDGIKKFGPISRAHPGLVDVLHVGMNEEEGYFFYIMEVADDIVSGREINASNYRPKTLASRIENNQALGVAEFLSMALQLCDALEFLHGKGLLHRDIKPANVLYVLGRPQLADPGLVAGAKEGATDVSMIGTVGYMAPDSSASPASDVYSLGKVLYQAAFGRPVAAFPELPTFLMDADNQAFFMGLNDIILKACAHNVRERYASAAELRRDLEELGQTLGLLKAGAPDKTA